MEIFLIRALQLVLALSILILLHEGGHFFFAKLFGIRVEKFYLFFDPWFHLFQFKPKKSDTTYGIGWLPLGGYCKIAGMIDESFDTEQMKQPVQPWEFRSKPAWQRLLVMIGGVLVNFLLALFIYAMIMFAWGESYIPVKDMSMGMKFNKEAKALGFQDGDILVGTEKRPFKEFDIDMFRDLSVAQRVDIIRHGQEMSISLPGEINLLNMLKSEPKFVAPILPAEVKDIVPDSPAEKAGVKPGAKILALGGKPIDSYNTFQDEIGRLDDQLTVAKTTEDSMKIRQTTIVVQQEGRLDTLAVTLTADLHFGFYPKMLKDIYQPVKVEYGFLASIPAGVKYGIGVLKGYVDDMKYVFTADGAKNLGGFGAIGSLFPPTWDWYIFWKMTAFLSIILAFMNILPIPALDGGHVLFLLYEMIARRKPSEKFMVVAEYIGFGILLLLMVMANLNDVLRLFGLM